MEDIRNDNSAVFIIAATHLPWKLDAAILKRFEKRIHIPLPDLKERALMFKIHLGTDTFHTIQEDQWIQLARRTERYSGADIAVVCKEALHRPIRRLCLATHFKQILNPKFDDHRQLWLPCSFDDPHAVPLTFDKILSAELCEPPVTLSDIQAAITIHKPTVTEYDLLSHQKFHWKICQECL
ncbi:unnamed protein product [Rotaria sordida]|nr:unnamed protein product [Rotaria sordida]